MRIVHLVDAAQAQAQVVQRVNPPPTISPPQRVQAINHQAWPEDPSGVSTSPPDDGISLALSPEAQEAARQAMYEELRASREAKALASAEESRSPDLAEEADVRRQKEEIQELERQDHEVRARGQTQSAIAGSLGKVNYTYQAGPDGRLYVVSGEVTFDTAAVPGDPEATLRKAESIAEAAFAPGDLSAADRRAAILAEMLKAQARQQLAKAQALAKAGLGGERAAETVAHVDQNG